MRHAFMHTIRNVYEGEEKKTKKFRLVYDWFFEWMVGVRKLRPEVGFEPTTFGLLIHFDHSLEKSAVNQPEIYMKADLHQTKILCLRWKFSRKWVDLLVALPLSGKVLKMEVFRQLRLQSMTKYVNIIAVLLPGNAPFLKTILLLFYRQLGCLRFRPKIKQLLSNCPVSELILSSKDSKFSLKCVKINNKTKQLLCKFWAHFPKISPGSNGKSSCL